MSAILPPPPDDEENKAFALGCTLALGFVAFTLMAIVWMVVHR